MRLPSELFAYVCGEQFQGDFTDEAREGELLDEEVEGALVFADFFQSNGSGFVTAWTALGGWVTG